MEQTNYTIHSGRANVNLRFAFISDTHNYPNEPIFRVLNRMDPDAVLVGGDFIQSKTDTLRGLEFLRAAASRWPVFCSSGKEHDFPDELIRRIEDTGAVFLRNRSTDFRGICLGGLNTLPLTGKTPEEREALIAIDRAWLEEFSRLPRYKVLLCHHPEYYDLFVKEYPIDLILSGHAHGGQIRLFGRGLWAPGQGWVPRYTSGLYDGRLLVGRGIGNTHRMPRINNNPEILEVRLLPSVQNGGTGEAISI